jgi:hypothetical protein
MLRIPAGLINGITRRQIFLFYTGLTDLLGVVMLRIITRFRSLLYQLYRLGGYAPDSVWPRNMQQPKTTFFIPKNLQKSRFWVHIRRIVMIFG